MAITYRSASEINNTIVGDMAQIGVVNSTSNSLSFILANIFTEDIKRLYDDLYLLDRSRRPSAAIGVDLDEWCRLFGITRGATQPAADTSATNFRFYLADNLTASDITEDRNGFIIPAGQRISDGTNEVVTISDAVFTPFSNSAYTSFVSASNRAVNIATGQLRFHNVDLERYLGDNLRDDVEVDLLCTNDKAISTGKTSESDQQLRTRWYSKVQSLNNSNENAILFELQSIGIPNARFMQNYYGVGTLGVVLETGTQVLSDTILEIANATIARITPYARVIRPEYVSVRIQMRIEVDNIDQVDIIRQNAVDAIYEFFRTLNVGQSLSLIDLKKAIENVTGIVRSTLTCIFLNGRKALLNTVHKADKDQKFVLALNNPIEFVVGG